MVSCRSLTHYCGPLIVIGVGIGFIAVGTLPVVVTIALGNKTSATIIGVGFIGFGLLLTIPGIIWCIIRRTMALHCCTRERLCSTEIDDKEPSLRGFPTSRGQSHASIPHPDIVCDLESLEHDEDVDGTDEDRQGDCDVRLTRLLPE